MRHHMSIFISVASCFLSLSVVSCAYKYGHAGHLYSSPDEALTAQKQTSDRLLAQVTPVQKPVGGSLVVIIPTDEFLLGMWRKPQGSSFKPTREQADFMVRSVKDQLLAMVEAIRKSQLFDKIEWRQSADPEREQFDEDFALIHRVKKAEWLLIARSQNAQKWAPIEIGPTSLSEFQRIMIWLGSIEETARKTKQ